MLEDEENKVIKDFLLNTIDSKNDEIKALKNTIDKIQAERQVARDALCILQYFLGDMHPDSAIEIANYVKDFCKRNPYDYHDVVTASLDAINFTIDGENEYQNLSGDRRRDYSQQNAILESAHKEIKQLLKGNDND